MSSLLEQLIEALRILPGVGPKSAQRMAYHVLERERVGGVGHCSRCRDFSEDALAQDDELLNKPALVNEIAQALAPMFGAPPAIRFETSERPAESLRQRTERVRDQRQVAAEDAFMNDPDVQQLISQHGARVVPDSIRPLDD